MGACFTTLQELGSTVCSSTQFGSKQKLEARKSNTSQKSNSGSNLEPKTIISASQSSFKSNPATSGLPTSPPNPSEPTSYLGTSVEHQALLNEANNNSRYGSKPLDLTYHDPLPRYEDIDEFNHNNIRPPSL